MKVADFFDTMEYRELQTKVSLEERLVIVESKPLMQCGLCRWGETHQSVCERDDCPGPAGLIDSGILDFYAVEKPRISSECVAFYRAVRANASKRAIPVYLDWIDETACCIKHAFYQDRLTDLHWSALEALGADVAASQSHKVVSLGAGVWTTRNSLRRKKAVVQ